MHFVKYTLALTGTIALLPLAHAAHADDTFPSWTAVAQSRCYHVGSDYDITTDSPPGSDMVVLAIHGGELEFKTSELAGEVAAMGGFSAALWALNLHNTPELCVIQKDGQTLWFYTTNDHAHVTATHFNESTAVALAASKEAVVSIHGMSDRYTQAGYFPQYAICVGGQSNGMRDMFIQLVRADASLAPLRVIDAVYPLDGLPEHAENDGEQIVTANNRCSHGSNLLTGVDDDNIVNLSGGGLQLEFSRSARKILFGNAGAGAPWAEDMEYVTVRATLIGIIQDVMEAKANGEID